MIGATSFALVLWGAIAGVALVFLYEVYAVTRDTGLIDRRGR